MDAFVKPIENLLAPLFKELPALPVNARKALAAYWPYIALVLGVAQLVAVLSLWRLGHMATTIVNQISAGTGPIVPELSLFYFLALVVLFVDGVILLMAFAPLKARSMRGWDLLFLGSLINVAYGLVLVFDGYYGGFMQLVSSLVGSAIGWYFLFQIRDMYSPNARTTATTTRSTGSSMPVDADKSKK